jgi:UDP-glucose 4-epimerase
VKAGRVKAIVFGGSGFLGSHVADCLTARGYTVTIFDVNPSPYLLPEQTMVEGDILDEGAVQAAIAGQDVVYNFAGIADLDDATTRPKLTVQLNVQGNLNIMEGCLRTPVSRFVYASTIYVYSQKGGFYRCSKQAAEVYIEEYQRRYGLNFTILRYGTLYGPRADERNSIFRYLQQALEKRRIVCHGNGEELREYIHVSDAARLTVDILHEDYQNRHIIITGHYPIKFKEMLLMIREILGGNIIIDFTGEESGDHYSMTPYSFVPKIGHKLVNHRYLDMGQGLLECLHEIYGYDR